MRIVRSEVKNISSKIAIFVLFAAFSAFLFGVYQIIANANAVEGKNNPESYWSTLNAPVFYGATKMTIPKDLEGGFDAQDSRFRIFARDFEDGDLTQEIVSSGSVDVTTEGNYELHYSVSDSHGNMMEIDVPVVVEDGLTEIKVERTIYSTPSVWNMDLAGFKRANYADRQMVGVYMPASSEVKVRVIDLPSGTRLDILTNDSQKDSSTVLTAEQAITTEFDGVPFIRTPVLSKEETSVSKTYKIEILYDANVKALDYYHYGDDQDMFMAKWNVSGNSYGLVEGETVEVVVPVFDKDKMFGYYARGFESLDKFFDYYKKVVEKYDEWIGLSYNPENPVDQNVHMRYTVKADAHGAGAAYYSQNIVATNSTSVASFFEMNWGGLHELAHGYQGSLGNGVMSLGEVSNNILGHYIQMDNTIYFHGGDWLGSLAAIENTENGYRLAATNYSDLSQKTRLYYLINLLDEFEGPETYAKIFKYYRDELNKGETMTNTDTYARAIAKIYGANVTPYLEAWLLDVTEETEEELTKNPELKFYGILKDMVGETDAELKYGLVETSELRDSGTYGALRINIEIDDIAKLIGKKIKLKNNGETYAEITISAESFTVAGLPVGAYYIEFPVLDDYVSDYRYVVVGQSENEIIYKYVKIDEIDFQNDLTMKLLGIYNTS